MLRPSASTTARGQPARITQADFGVAQTTFALVRYSQGVHVTVVPRRYSPVMGLAFPPSLSPSSVSAFKSCPLAFKFSYIDRLPEPPSPAATKGTLVHRALELLMCRPQPDRTVDAALVDLETARVEMADDPDLAGLELTDEQRAQFDADAEELVRKYFLL